MKQFLLVLALPALVTSFAAGSPLISFRTPSSQKVTTGGGQISYSGGANPLVGSNILISSISAGSNTVTCNGCVLNFTTGSFLNQTTLGSTRTWTFDGGPQQPGQFTITGKVKAAGITTRTTLLSGYFTSPTLSLTGILGTVPRYRMFTGSLVDVNNSALIDYFLGAGYSAANGHTFSGSYTQNFVDNLTRPSQIPILSDSLLSGTVGNDQPVPEPASILLFGSVGFVLSALIYARRRSTAATSVRTRQ
jgi:hypothetical protein